MYYRFSVNKHYIFVKAQHILYVHFQSPDGVVICFDYPLHLQKRDFWSVIHKLPRNLFEQLREVESFRWSLLHWRLHRNGSTIQHFLAYRIGPSSVTGFYRLLSWGHWDRRWGRGVPGCSCWCRSKRRGEGCFDQTLVNFTNILRAAFVSIFKKVQT